jgi:hypothetical protein
MCEYHSSSKRHVKLESDWMHGAQDTALGLPRGTDNEAQTHAIADKRSTEVVST